MKKTIICIALAVVMVLGVCSVALAVNPDPETYNPGTGTADGSDTIITIEVTDTPPVNISATVPVELPFIVVRNTDGAASADGVTTYYPQDGWYGITNTSDNQVQKTNDAGEPLYKDADGAETTDADDGAGTDYEPVMVKQDVSIRVNGVSVSHFDPMNAQWTLVPAATVATPATGNKFSMNTTIGGVELPALGQNVAVAQRVLRPETPGATVLWKDIEQDAKLSLPVTAKAGGINGDYTENIAKANAFKVVYTLGRTPVVTAP